MSDGEKVEFDSPSSLLEEEGGLFSSLHESFMQSHASASAAGHSSPKKAGAADLDKKA